MKVHDGEVRIEELRQLLIEMRTPTTAIKCFAEDNIEETNIEILKENNNYIIEVVGNLLEELNKHIDQLNAEMFVKEKDENLNNDIRSNFALYEEVIIFLIETGEISIAMLQRKFIIGYNRAVKWFEFLEENEIIEMRKDSIRRKVVIENANAKLNEIRLKKYD